MTDREELIELVNKLFIYTDEKNWEKLKGEVFESFVFLDMTSLGGKAEKMQSKAICDMWDEGFKGIDSINHLGGNYLVNASGDEASVFAYATATHFKESAKNGKTREFVGTYDLKMKKGENGWRINHFTYTLKYLNGNVDLS